MESRTPSRHVGRLGPALALIATVALTASAFADGPSGTFEHSVRGAIEPQFAGAFPVRASWDRSQTGIQVLLTASPFDAMAASEAEDPYLHVANSQEALRDADHVLINVWDDGKVAVSGTYDRDNAQFIVNTDMGMRAEIEPITGDRIVGRVWTEEAVETSDGETYSLDLSFDVPISRPPASEPLPEGGGAPGEALIALSDAVLAGSWEGVKALLSAEQLEEAENSWAETDEERIEAAVGSLSTWLLWGGNRARSVSIREGALRVDGVAELEVAVEHDGATIVCAARMRQVDGRWLFERMSMLTME